MRDPNKCCANCEHWIHIKRKDIENFGQCTAHPPQWTIEMPSEGDEFGFGDWNNPEVMGYNSCGEFLKHVPPPKTPEEVKLERIRRAIE